MKSKFELPIPKHFAENNVGEVFRVPYQQRASQARQWAEQYNIKHHALDKTKILLGIIDQQITFCIPGFELFVAGQSGTGAVDDSSRLAQFIYKYLGVLSKVFTTLDAHTAMQIFHEIFLINDKGEHPLPTDPPISLQDILDGKWKINPAVAPDIANGNYGYLQNYLPHYGKELEQGNKYALKTWPYHAIFTGIGFALVPAVEEAIFFHTIARNSQSIAQIKGGHPLTENYSPIKQEVTTDHLGRPIGQKNPFFFKALQEYDVVILSGEAASHCFASFVEDLLNEIVAKDRNLAKKIYILEDCTSPVVIPGVLDFTTQANDALQKFKNAGMNLVKSTVPIEDWPGINL